MKKKLLCDVSEKAKIVANECIERGYIVSETKLSLLLILMQGSMLSKHKKPFFKQKVVATRNMPIIKEVIFDFLNDRFDEKKETHIYLPEEEWEVMDEIINEYGDLNTIQLSELNRLMTINGVCYRENAVNVISNDLIEKIFDYYEYGDSVVKYKAPFQKTIK